MFRNKHPTGLFTETRGKSLQEVTLTGEYGGGTLVQKTQSVAHEFVNKTGIPVIARIPEFHQRMTEPKSVALPTWRHPNVKDEKYTSKADSSLQGEKRDSPKYASFRASSPLTETPANGQQKTSISSFLLQSMHIPLFSDTKVCSYGTEYHNQAKKSSFVEGFQKKPCPSFKFIFRALPRSIDFGEYRFLPRDERRGSAQLSISPAMFRSGVARILSIRF